MSKKLSKYFINGFFTICIYLNKNAVILSTTKTEKAFCLILVQKNRSPRTLKTKKKRGKIPEKSNLIIKQVILFVFLKTLLSFSATDDFIIFFLHPNCLLGGLIQPESTFSGIICTEKKVQPTNLVLSWYMFS